jgi:oxaloacetate decarboxylase alpha subunit
MRAEAMLPAIRDIDAAGYDGAEFAVPTSQFPRAVRDLKENPWDWLRLGTAAVSNTRLRLHGGIHTRLAKVPLSVRELFYAKMVELGIQTTRTSDPWNDYVKLGQAVDFMRSHGVETVANIIYSVSPRHTAEYYATKTREAVAMAPYRVCFKDVGGLMTPEAARELIPVVLSNAGDTEVEFHAHSNSGLAPYVVLVAADLGMRIIHTALPPLADGTSQPSVFNVVANLRERGYDVNVDLEPLARASKHFHRVAEVEDLPVGAPQAYDERLFKHQVPGGMISNMRFQLKQLKAEHRLDDVIDEVVRVRQDFGYPIMVTPLAQFVGTQAVVNVLSRGRYTTVTDETILYALGQWGQEGAVVMDQAVRALILERPRAKEIEAGLGASSETDEPSLAEVRRKYGPGISDEELIVRSYLGASSTSNEMPGPGSPAQTYDEYLAAHEPEAELLRRIGASDGIRRFYLRSSGGSVTIEK